MYAHTIAPMNRYPAMTRQAGFTADQRTARQAFFACAVPA